LADYEKIMTAMVLIA
jgi:hypothetical protein